MKQFFQIWKYSLGSFSDEKTEPYDNYVAGIRTVIFVSYMVTNSFIVSGVIRHWNANTNNTSVSVLDGSVIDLISTRYLEIFYSIRWVVNPCLVAGY